MPKMYGPSFDGSGEIVNRDVPEADITAYRKAGYELGEVEEAPKETADAPKTRKK